MTPDSNPFAAIAEALQPLVDEAKGLRGDVHAAESARKLSARYNMGMLVLVAVGLVAVLVIGWQNNQLGRQVARTNNTLADCTVPGGACYTAANARTGTAIAALIRAETYVSECGRLHPGEVGPTYDAALEACVADRLLQHAAPTPAPTPAPGPRPTGTR